MSIFKGCGCALLIALLSLAGFYYQLRAPYNPTNYHGAIESIGLAQLHKEADHLIAQRRQAEELARINGRTTDSGWNWTDIKHAPSGLASLPYVRKYTATRDKVLLPLRGVNMSFVTIYASDCEELPNVGRSQGQLTKRIAERIYIEELF